MARYNEILVGHLNRGLQKFLQMKGEPPAPQLASEISPGVSLFTGVENRYIFGWNKFSAFVDVTGGAAQFAGFRLRNPAGSNAVAVLEFLAVSSGAVQAIFLGQRTINTNFTTVSGGSRLDARFGVAGASSSVLVVSSDVNAGALAIQIGKWNAAVATPVMPITDETQQIPILPGDAFEVGAGAAASNMIVWVMWRERFLEESERT